MTRQGTWTGLYCNTATALAIQHGLGAAGAGGVRTRRAGSRRALGARRWADWALGAGARGRRAAIGAGARGARQGRAAAGATGARGAHGSKGGRGVRGVRPGRWARGQCAPGRASWASWVVVHPAWFFDLVFDSVMFLSHRLNPVHEHCS